MHRLWLFNALAGVLRWLVFCAGCCSALPGCPLRCLVFCAAARLVASRWSSAVTPQPAIALSRRPGQQQLCQGAPCQQHLPDGSSLQRPCQPLRRSAPASNKPHSAEKSTPVWLAIWRIWAGFANSQHRYAAFTTPDNICAHSSLLPPWSCCSDRRKSLGPSAPIAYATSVSPPDEAVAWPGAQVLGAG